MRCVVCTWMYVGVFRCVVAGQLASDWFSRSQCRELVKLLRKCLCQRFLSCSLVLDFPLPRTQLLLSSPIRLLLIHLKPHLHLDWANTYNSIHTPFVQAHIPPFFDPPTGTTTTRTAKQQRKQAYKKARSERKKGDLMNKNNTFACQQQPLPSFTTSTQRQRRRRFTPWTTIVFTLALAAVAVCASTKATPTATTANVSVVVKRTRASPATVDSSSSSPGLIGCVPDDDKEPYSSTSSFESGDSLPSSPSSPLPTPFFHSLAEHKDTFLCPTCTDNLPASLPSTGRPNHQGPLSSVPSRFSTNRPHPPEDTTTCSSCHTQLTPQLPYQSTSDNTNDDFVTPPSPTMSPVSSSLSPSSRPLSPSIQQTQPLASSSSQQHTLQQHQQQQPSFPEPLVFQYVLYYPGNLPLVITAGHGGSSKPGEVVTRKTTHRFRRIPDLATTTDPIEISSFAESLYPSTSQFDPTTDAAIVASLNSNEETMPSMAPRDQTRGGNFKKDLNTHSIALNLANAISCLTSGSTISYGGGGVNSGPGGAIVPTTDGNFVGGGPSSSRAASSSVTATATSDHGTNDIPARCEQQGPWGDDDSDYPFLTRTSLAPSSTPTRTPTPTASSALHRQQQESAKRFFGQQGQNYPHVIVFRIPRQFVDVNRNIRGENAIAEGDSHAEAAWREYHDLIDHVQKMALQKANISARLHQEQEREHRSPQQQSQWMPPQAPSPGRGLLLDIHGNV